MEPDMPPSVWNRIRSIVDLVAAISVISIAGVLVWRIALPKPAIVTQRLRPSLAIPETSIALDNTFFKGRPDAAVVVIEYADFECPACRRFATETFPHLAERFVDRGRIKFGFRHLPLNIHPTAKGAAIAAQCAGEQGRFWEFYETMFQPRSGRLTETFLRSVGDSLGLDIARWSQCQTGSGSESVATHMAEAARLQLRGTPTFYVGRETPGRGLNVDSALSGAQPLAEFERAIVKSERVTAAR